MGIQELPQQNLALQALRKLIEDEIKTRLQRNVVQKRSFKSLLNDALNRYHNRSLEATRVIMEVIGVAKLLREETGHG